MDSSYDLRIAMLGTLGCRAGVGEGESSKRSLSPCSTPFHALRLLATGNAAPASDPELWRTMRWKTQPCRQAAAT